MFTEEEVKEAFGILDLNKDGAITVEDLSFFLDYIGEKTTPEEVEEMIRMCDLDGGGEVRYDEFWRMVGGQSLTPIGQAFPPTKELVERRNYLNQLMMEKELS
jgi:Ca2+-binding EF-hand superfamily protein